MDSCESSLDSAIEWWQDLLEPLYYGRSLSTGGLRFPVSAEEIEEEETIRLECPFVFRTLGLRFKSAEQFHLRRMQEMMSDSQQSTKKVRDSLRTRRKVLPTLERIAMKNWEKQQHKQKQKSGEKVVLNLTRDHHKRAMQSKPPDHQTATYNTPRDVLAREVLKRGGWATKSDLECWEMIGNREKTPLNSPTLARRFNKQREEEEFAALSCMNSEFDL